MIRKEKRIMIRNAKNIDSAQKADVKDFGEKEDLTAKRPSGDKKRFTWYKKMAQLWRGKGEEGIEPNEQGTVITEQAFGKV